MSDLPSSSPRLHPTARAPQTTNPSAASGYNGAALDNTVRQDGIVSLPSTGSVEAGLVTIRVRSPSFPEQLFEVQLARTDTVLDMKTTLAEMQGLGKPALECQRLIFGGKLLLDAELIGEVLKKAGQADPSTVQTIHLVIKGGATQPAPALPVKVGEELRRRHVAHQTAQTPTAASADSEQHAQTASSSAIPATTPLQTSSTAAAVNTPSFQTGFVHASHPLMAIALPYQIVIINGLPYAMHTPHTPLLPSGMPGMQPIPHHPHAIPHFPLHPQHIPVTTTPAPPPPPAPAPAPVLPANPPNFGLNAAAAADPDDEFGDQNRDQPQNPFWLLIKLTFLVYIFSQNASMGRIIMMNLVALLVFLVQTGFVRLRRAPTPAPVVPAPVVPAPVAVAEAGAGGDGEAERVADGDGARTDAPIGEATDAIVGAEAGAVAVVQRPLWVEVKNFAVGFFTSLVPEQQEVV